MAVVLRTKLRPRGPKYGNKKVVADGYTFDSEKEADRYTQLELMEKCGDIHGLAVHPEFPLVVNGQLICIYTADFSYVDHGGDLVVEDTKGIGKPMRTGIHEKRRRFTTRTPVYQLKKKLMKAIRGIEIREI